MLLYTCWNKQMIQVQRSTQLKLEELFSGVSQKQTIMMMKAYALGYMGIPFSYSGLSDVMRVLDNFEDWVTNEIISSGNFVKACNMILMDQGSLHNKVNSEKGYLNYISKFKAQTEEIMGNLAQNPYFLQPEPNYQMYECIQFQQQCSICCSQLKRQDITYLQCKHFFHMHCLHLHVKNMIQNGQFIINCPEQRCNIQMSDQQLLNFCTPELESKYYSNQMNRYVQRNGRNTCWCPTPDCQLVFEYDSSISEYNCKRCCRDYCLKCRCQYHKNRTCEEYRRYKGLNPEDQSFVDFAQGAKFKQCPNCQFWVERNLGCPTMTCRCKQQFCYECGGVSCPHGRCSKTQSQRI